MAYVEAYLRAAGMFRDYSLESQDPVFSETVELDLSTVVPSLSGPKRPHDRVAVTDMKADFQACLDNKVRTDSFNREVLRVHEHSPPVQLIINS